MATEQVFIGITTSGLCAVGLVRESWLLSRTRKGQRLVQLCGTRHAFWVLRGLLVAGLLFGLALATGVVNPIRWSGISESPRGRDLDPFLPGLTIKSAVTLA